MAVQHEHHHPGGGRVQLADVCCIEWRNVLFQSAEDLCAVQLADVCCIEWRNEGKGVLGDELAVQLADVCCIEWRLFMTSFMTPTWGCNLLMFVVSNGG